ncbi:hypothetical protein XENTR_v10006626 [Xenopus tropicalis]|uniref:Ubiquinol-cytochrome-c reductase complex assembly factor 3 n=1 Tax=Xenopus tropicalis TaxID=8364 RepID=A0A6I8SY71_XENTR|nr:ubiquinol-cytochrome-c reductase complex assembly factor 3 [Xenopus tropicalis]XP_004911927.1 ubiquinol-cytochrome-c reductase complex assembly factor 3 [Xenopus tropicalis]KAE8626425.1 hypothetical protein XENTR_v10006626 [Xenopus tropicalis]|eukprot:XP_004911926.1 PREDICTED: ubiquinol-cytochrome-c reductase complex assembly factor 3 [Xenopus tropicalis]
METLRQIVKGTFLLGVCTGIGGVLWVLVAPGQQQRLEMCRNFPEANPAMLAEVRKRNELVLKVIEESAKTNENLARRPPWSS